jgi:hypothetical protein
MGHGHPKISLGREVVVDARAFNADLLGQIAKAKAVVPAPADQSLGAVEDFLSLGCPCGHLTASKL